MSSGGNKSSTRVLSPIRKSASFMPAFASRLFGGKDEAEAVLDDAQQQQRHSDKEVQQQTSDQEEIEMLCKLLCVLLLAPRIRVVFSFR